MKKTIFLLLFLFVFWDPLFAETTPGIANGHSEALPGEAEESQGSFAEAQDDSEQKDENGFILKQFLTSLDLALERTPAKTPSLPKWDELTLYATRIARPITRLDEVPANVSIINKDDLKDLVPKSFQEAVQAEEGVVLYDTVGNGLDASFGLRGFFEPDATTFLLDGVRVNEVDGGAVPYPYLIMSDMEMIEIDRGSSSPVYGSGAFAGVVHLQTRKPSDKLIEIFGGLEFSSFKGVRFYQGVSGSIPDKLTPLKGKLTYYFNGGRHVISEGFRDNDESRLTHFNIKSGYELPDGQGGVRVGIKHNEGYFSSPGELTLSQYHANPTDSNKPLDFRRSKNTIVQIEGDKKFWDDKITASILGSWRFNRFPIQLTSGTFFDWMNGYNPDTHRIFQKSRENTLVWQLEYNDAWTSWLAGKSSIGMELRKGTDQALQLNAFQGVVREADGPDTDRNSQHKNVGLFWRQTVGLFDRLHAHVGMRHDFHWLRTDDQINPGANLRKRWDKSTISVGTTFKPFGFIDIFGNYSQGFRVPSISDIAPFASGIATDLQPERSDSYEVGTRLRYKKLASFKTSFFLIDMKNEIIFDSTAITPATPWGQNTNLGRSRRKGIELKLETKPIEETYLYYSYSWTSARVRETDADGVPFNNRPLGQVPAHRMTFGATIAPFKKLGEWFEGFKASMDGVYVSKQHPQSYESTSQALLNSTGHWIKSYLLWNFRVSYELKGLRFYFKINNIFDEKYFSRAIAATSFGTAIYPAGNYLFVNRGAPREYVWGMDWKF